MLRVRFLSFLFLCIAVSGLTKDVGRNSGAMRETLKERLESLRRDLILAREKATGVKTPAQSRSVSEMLEGLNKEAEEVNEKKTPDSARGVDVEVKGEVSVKDMEKDPIFVMDGIYYLVGELADEINDTCGIDITAIFTEFLPATLAGANEAGRNLTEATKALSNLLASEPGLADDLQAFVNSTAYKDKQVAENIDKTFNQIDKKLANIETQLFCAEAQLIATRLQLTLYGGVGFANGFMCNKVFVELTRCEMNATQLLKETVEVEDFLKNYTEFLVEDITCYEKELEAFNKIVPVKLFTEASPLQTVAFTADFLVNYGLVLMNHRFVLSLEADILKQMSEAKKEDDEANEVKKKKKLQQEVDEDTESLTEQLRRLLKRLNEVSAKKKADEAVIGSRAKEDKPIATDVNNQEGKDAKDSVGEGSMPTNGEKTAIKKSYYGGRDKSRR